MTECLNMPVTQSQDCHSPALDVETTHAVMKSALSKEEMQKRVGEMLDEALKNGILEEALQTPANILPLSLPSCPHLSCERLKRQIQELLEDGVVSGVFGLQQAERLRDLISTYNKAMDGMAEVGELMLPHLSDVQAKKFVSGHHGEIENTKDAETLMRKLLEDALASGLLEQALKEGVPNQPEDTSGTEQFNFAPAERLADQPSISDSSKLDSEDSKSKMPPPSPSDYEKKLQAAERSSDVA
eukprot:gnl/MRDRNA2_/MRDRNA2_81509_c0_seq3.p1 gnl/MRDRNA2_/MRDRNA2_81509_c0~~gnl/MRDRNA2_/MRDRNA2_81509_c0_seq3.p1  ORF type:complete len:243 (-),score=65.99 gnl/MRDRNA2_/MRDRNA2_81509_c0_seq3:335-1063(-)